VRRLGQAAGAPPSTTSRAAITACIGRHGSQGNDINVHKFNIFAGGCPLFKEATLQLLPGRRYGLVGARSSAHVSRRWF